MSQKIDIAPFYFDKYVTTLWTTVNSTPSRVILAYPHPLPQPPYLLIEVHLFVLLILLVLLFFFCFFFSACLFYSVSFVCLSVLFSYLFILHICLFPLFILFPVYSHFYSAHLFVLIFVCSPVYSVCLFVPLFILFVLVRCDPFSSLLSFHYSLHLLTLRSVELILFWVRDSIFIFYPPSIPPSHLANQASRW